MKVEFERDSLNEALTKVGSVVERKTTMPILGNILLEAKGDELKIWATNLEVGVQSSCPVKVIAEGKICIPARSLMDIVRELPENKGKLRKGDNEWMILESGKAQFRVVGVSAAEYPEVVSSDTFKFQKLRGDTLQTGLDRTSFAMSSDEMRYNLNGIYLETRKGGKGQSMIRFVATDGHRLALSDQPLSDDETLTMKKGAILPRKGVVELRKLLGEDKDTMEVAISDGSAAFRKGPTLITMRLVSGEFPDYGSVIPKTNKKRLLVDRSLLTDSLRRVSLLSEGKSRCVRFGIKGNGVHLAATTPELGEAEEDVMGEFDGGQLDIGFNARYVLEAISATDGDKVVIELDHGQSPGLVRNFKEDSGYFAVIMPMRL